MRTALLVFIGGGTGSVLRWLTGAWALKAFGPSFPMGTLLINLIGCFVMGLLFRLVTLIQQADDARFLLMTGVLGGFTTFSAFALDAAALWMRQEHGAALAYIGLSLFGTLLGVAAGLWIGKLVAA